MRNSPFMNQNSQGNQSKEIFEIKDHLVKVERNVSCTLQIIGSNPANYAGWKINCCKDYLLKFESGKLYSK